MFTLLRNRWFTLPRNEWFTFSGISTSMNIQSFHKNGNPKSSKAVGLIQFTQTALEGMGEFAKATDATKGSLKRFNELKAVKLHYAKMGEIDQLDKVKKYLKRKASKEDKPQDIYLHIFATKWCMINNYHHKAPFPNTRGTATQDHQDHFHLGLK